MRFYCIPGSGDDVIRMGRQHIYDNVLALGGGNTEGGEEAHLEIPVHPKLRAIIDATPMVGVKTFMVTHFGKPYTAPGFGNWFRDLCDKAGCPDVSPHGLRKATARRLAEIGCTEHEIASVTATRPEGGGAVYEGGESKRTREIGYEENRRGWMVNVSMSNLRIRSTMLELIPLKTNNQV